MTRPAATVGGLTLLSRILGLVRDVGFAYVFGTTGGWDAFVIAFAVPNMFRRLFGEGALTSAFLPPFVGRLTQHGPEAASGLLRAVMGWLVLFLGGGTVLAVAGLFVAEGVYAGDGKAGLVLSTLRITLPYALLICTTAVYSAALNGARHFAGPAVAPVVMNLVLIGATFLALEFEVGEDRLRLLAVAVLVAGVLQMGIQVPLLLRRDLSPVPGWRWKQAGLGEVMRAFLPTVAGLAVVQANEVLDNIIAEVFVPGDGAVAALYYGNRLHQFPIALIGFSLATAAFPALSAAAAKKQMAEYRASIGQGLRLAFFLAIPAAVGLGALSPEIVDVLFERGRFDDQATRRTALVVFFYCFGIPFYAANMTVTRAFYSLRDVRTPLRVSLITVVLNVGLNLALVRPMGESGLALATSVTGLVNFALLFGALRKKEPLEYGEWLPTAAAAGALGGGMLAGLLAFKTVWPAPEGTRALALWLAAACAGGGGGVLLAGRLFGMRAAREVFGVFRRS